MINISFDLNLYSNTKQITSQSLPVLVSCERNSSSETILTGVAGRQSPWVSLLTDSFCQVFSHFTQNYNIVKALIAPHI